MRYFFWFFCINSLLYSQSGNWWIVFSDKECSQVIELSDRALERRIKQGIKLDFYDYSVCDEYITVLKQYNLHIRNTSRWLNAVSVKIDSKKVLDQISNLSFVKDIYPVRKMVKQTEINLFKEHIPDYYNSRIFSSLLYGSSYNQIDMLGGVDLHNAGFFGDDMIIAVFDAGFIDVESLPIFENLWANNQILDSYDFVDKDNNVFKGSSHGTMVLSTMGGYMPDSLIGTAPQAKYMLFRTLIDKFLNRKDYSIELDLLISLLKQNRIDLDWDEKFEFLQKSNFKSMDYLLTSINRLVYEQRISESLQEKSDLRKARSFNNLEDFKTYFFEEINSLITIKKVQDNSLRDISEKVKVNKSNVKLAKEYLLIGNIQKSVEILSLEENNINEDIKRWLDSAKLFLSTIDKIEKLEKEIFINE